MKQKLIIYRIALIVLMILFPWFTVTFAGDNGMGICFLLFYIVDPLFAVLGGMLAAKDGKRLWRLPIYTPVAYVLGTWLFLDGGEPAFLIYAGIYMVLGFIAMLVMSFLEKHVKYKKIFMVFVLLILLVVIWILWSEAQVDVQPVLPDKTI